MRIKAENFNNFPEELSDLGGIFPVRWHISGDLEGIFPVFFFRGHISGLVRKRFGRQEEFFTFVFAI